MANFWKDVLRPGRYYLPQTGEQSTITGAQVVEAERNLRAMLANGVSVPLLAEHQSLNAGDPDAKKQRYVHATMGWVRNCKRDTESVLWLELSVPNASDRNRLRAVRYVSARINH